MTQLPLNNIRDSAIAIDAVISPDSRPIVLHLHPLSTTNMTASTAPPSLNGDTSGKTLILTGISTENRPYKRIDEPQDN
jgi:hypothetical protein